MDANRQRLVLVITIAFFRHHTPEQQQVLLTELTEHSEDPSLTGIKYTGPSLLHSSMHLQLPKQFV